jgi:16S rRNA (guanine527-N7)-methyltransferase
VESRRTKCLFLKKVVQELKLPNVRVEQARLEDLLTEAPLLGKFDAFTSRATQTLVPTLLMAAQFVHPGGEAFLWKGSRREEEMAQDRSWNELWELDGLLGIGDGLTVVSRFTRR